MVKRGTGGMGFPQGGKSYFIKSGSGFCYIQESAIGPDGRGYITNKIDVRDRKTIQTDGWGPITVKSLDGSCAFQCWSSFRAFATFFPSARTNN